MSTIHYHGIAWQVNGVKNGKGILTHQDTDIVWNQEDKTFQFCQGEFVILTATTRSELVREATDCILDSYAAHFVPTWEIAA
jgi:hypothetical protein